MREKWDVRRILGVAAGVWLAQVLGPSPFSALLPLAAAVLLARLASPSADAVSRAFRVSRKVGGAIYASVLCLLLVWLTVLVSGSLIDELAGLLGRLPDWAQQFTALLGTWRDRLSEWLPGDPDGGAFRFLSGMVSRAASEAGTLAAGALGTLVQGFPGGVLSLVVSAVGFIYLTADMDGAARCFRSLFGVGDEAAQRVKDASDAVFRVLRAALILLGVTFAELWAGLAILRIENALAAAVLIALVDFLPVLGCGTILVPWAALSFLGGQNGRGVGLLVLLAVVWLVRQFLEPRLIGSLSGVHPFLILASTYLGYKLCGVGGMILAPVILSIWAASRGTEVRGFSE